MSRLPRRRTSHGRTPKTGSLRMLLIALGSVAAIAGIVALVQASGQSPTEPAGAVRTGEAAGPITIDQPEIDLGRVPLNVVVPVTVRLANRSERTVTLSQPTAEALEGC
jgi:flagellar basal body-associated protein FliL